MKILVIFTGGTIGSTVKGDYISTDGNKPYIILEKYNEMYPNSVDWVTDSPYTILSENATCKTYGQLYESVKKGLTGDFDGIIITHGSDTLQYSAAFLSLALGSDVIPILLVSSNYVLEDERANGMENFRCAVDFIQNQRGRGVFVPYQNTGEACKIHMGSRLMPHNMYSDDLFSMGKTYYGIYTSDGFEYGKDRELYKEEAMPVQVDFSHETTEVLVLQPCPGMKYPQNVSGVKAVLLHAYHGGTLCVCSQELQRFMTVANDNNIPVWLVGANPETDYDSCKQYETLGIRVMPQVSPIYAYVRLWLVNSP